MIDSKTFLTASFAVLGSTLASSAIPAKHTHPNIVLLIADDCRMRDLGCYGNEFSRTPNIDRIASEGLMFNRFFQATAMSSPTRQCLLTGLYPIRNGAYPNHAFIREGVRTLPSYLKDCGYRVATQGKRHYAPIAQYPFEYQDSLSVDTPTLNPDRVESFLKDVSKSGEPFFLYLCSTDPHSPWTRGNQNLFNPDKIQLPENLVNTPETRRQYCNYLAEINFLDRHVGQIDELLKKYGLSENTVFIFTSEQGYSFPFAKWTCYDEGLQTGFIVRWPGVTEAGSRTDCMFEYVDVMPTLVDIAGGTVPAGLDGRSFLKTLRGEKQEEKKQVFALQTSRGIVSGPEYYGIRSVRDGRYRLIRNLTPEARFHCTTFQSKVFKSWETEAVQDPFAARQVERYAKRPETELYDVLQDPFEQHNLADDLDYAKIVKRLGKALDRWMELQGDKGQETEMEAFHHMAAKMGVK